MAPRKQNCWEYMKCERHPGGSKVPELGICSAAADKSCDGINFGKNAGRFCWAVAGTLCGGQVQGSFAEKRSSCISCDFFKLVQEEEGTATYPTKFLSFFLENEKSSFLKEMTYKHVKAGERFITQGEAGDDAYIIQRGSCLVIVERNGKLYPSGHRGVGDIVGEIALLTGEPRSAHVEAETDMEVWVLKKALFDNISKETPELMDFLTELVADRFDSKRPTADRSIGKYVATDIIGRGGYSIVYKGIHRGLNMPVAIKMMRHNLAMDPDFLDNFLNEAKTIGSLNHENIIKVYDIEERFRTVFIIMELVEGESLKDMIQRLKTIPPSVAANFLVQICSGVRCAHQLGILHQDINPNNILVQRNDRVKIVDFGVACPPGSDDRSIFDGTIHYMAPEQILCDPVTERTDIYSLGITAYEMVTGRMPFAEDSVKAVMDMHVHRDIPDPVERVPDLPEALRRFIIKACRRDPAERYQNMAEAMEDLQPVVKEPGLASKDLFIKERKLSTLFLIYKDEHQLALNELMEEFSTKVQNLGVVLKGADLKDL